MAKTKSGEETPKNDIIAELNKIYGKGTLIRASQKAENLEVIDSGSILLNKALGIGGIPVGKLIEVYGPESSGKSTFTIHVMANFQKAGKQVALVDAEHSFDRNYAEHLGVNLDQLIIVQPNTGEEGYNVALHLIESGEIGLVVIDSHTALTPTKIKEEEVGTASMGVQARMNSQAITKIKPLLDKNNCTVLAISQLRTNIGGYGDPNVPTGGQAYKFYSDIRIKFSKVIEKAEETNRTTIEIVKNKLAKPFGKAIVGLIWGEGFDKLQEIIDLAVEKSILTKGGAGWYSVPTKAIIAGADGVAKEIEDVVKFQGDNNLKAFLVDNPEYLKELEEKVS